MNREPRFRFPQGSECGIYNLPVLNLLRPGDELYITEGCSDCWAMLSAGHKAIAIPSATLLSKKDKELLKSISQAPTKPPRGEAFVSPSGDQRVGVGVTFHMYPDRDEPGERLFLQLKELLPNLEHHQLPVGCKDFSDYYLATRDKPPPNLPGGRLSCPLAGQKGGFEIFQKLHEIFQKLHDFRAKLAAFGISG